MSCAGSASKKNQSTNGNDRHRMTPFCKKNVETGIRRPGRCALGGNVTGGGYEAVHMAADNAGAPKPLILKRNADSPLRQEG
jgi:hypothetical protein